MLTAKYGVFFPLHMHLFVKSQTFYESHLWDKEGLYSLCWCKSEGTLLSKVRPSPSVHQQSLHPSSLPGLSPWLHLTRTSLVSWGTEACSGSKVLLYQVEAAGPWTKYMHAWVLQEDN